MYFEGAGDLLGFADGWFGGYRQRSEFRAFPILSEIFGNGRFSPWSSSTAGFTTWIPASAR